jgi:hypothetical protein
MGVYRRHSGGIWYGADGADNFFAKNGIAHLLFYKKVEEYFKKDFSKKISDFMEKTIFALLKLKDFDKLKQLSVLFPQEYETLLINKQELLKKLPRKLRHINRFIYALCAVALAEVAIILYLLL